MGVYETNKTCRHGYRNLAAGIFDRAAKSAYRMSCVIAFNDSDGAPLTEGTNYKLNLPKDVPAANFWSVTLYEVGKDSGLANGRPFPSLGSRDNPVRNADGSTDLYLGA